MYYITNTSVAYFCDAIGERNAVIGNVLFLPVLLTTVAAASARYPVSVIITVPFRKISALLLS